MQIFHEQMQWTKQKLKGKCIRSFVLLRYSVKVLIIYAPARMYHKKENITNIRLGNIYNEKVRTHRPRPLWKITQWSKECTSWSKQYLPKMSKFYTLSWPKSNHRNRSERCIQMQFTYPCRLYVARCFLCVLQWGEVALGAYFFVTW